MPLETSTSNDEDKYIVDVGMNHGEDSEYYFRRGYKVIGIEANPVVARDASASFARQGVEVTVVNKAISNKEGRLPFYVNKTSDKWSSLIEGIGSRVHGSEVIEVETVNLKDVLEPYSGRIHYVKIDIESMDHVALEQTMELSMLPRYVSVENGNERMLDLLSAQGYQSFHFSNQKHVPDQRVPADTRQGTFVDHRFKPGTSGLFGDDLRGKWLTIEEAYMVNEAIVRGKQAITQTHLWAEAVGWFDLHASTDKPGWLK
ncbi:MAG: FkbM family methyltransferase [Verrucomicrobiota bacterium]